MTALAFPGDLDAEAARDLIDGMRRDVADLGERITTAYLGRAWVALGYPSWDALCEAEFDGARLRLPREDRAEQVQSLRSAGLSTRAIGSALGVSNATVARDLSTVADVTDGPVQSLDGRTRPSTQPARPAVHVVTTEKTVEEFIADRDTGEVLSVEDWQKQDEPRWQPDPPSEQAQADRDRRVSAEAFSANLAKNAWFFARLARTDLDAAPAHAAKYVPDSAAAFGGVDPAVLRDAARYLLALADAWKKVA